MTAGSTPTPSDTTALRLAFEPFTRLDANSVHAFEAFLLGGIVTHVQTLANRPAVDEQGAALVFSAIPQAAAMAIDEQLSTRIPTWPADDVDGLADIRSAIAVSAQGLGSQPQNLMLRLVPILTQQLTKDAGKPDSQIGNAWMQCMVELAAPAQHGIDRDTLRAVLVATVHRHQAATIPSSDR